MTFSELSESEQALLANSDQQLIRRAFLAGRGALAKMRTAAIDYRAVTKPIYDKLDAGAGVPYPSGLLAGALTVTRSEIEAAVAQFEALLGAWDKPEVAAEHARFIGAVNLDGSHGGS